MAKMITNPPEMKQFTAGEIIRMTPARLHKELKQIFDVEPDLQGKIEAFLNFPLKWNQMSAYQYSQVALTWAALENNPQAQQDRIEKTLDMLYYHAVLLRRVIE